MSHDPATKEDVGRVVHAIERLEGKLDDVHERLADHGERITVIESRTEDLAIMRGRVAQHESALSAINVTLRGVDRDLRNLTRADDSLRKAVQAEYWREAEEQGKRESTHRLVRAATAFLGWLLAFVATLWGLYAEFHAEPDEPASQAQRP